MRWVVKTETAKNTTINFNCMMLLEYFLLNNIDVYALAYKYYL